LYERFIDENDSLSLVITTGSWLTGTDNPLLNVAYLASPVSDHLLLQIISRINRPYKKKEDALLVDYVGIDWKKIRNMVDNIL
jgi:type I restriction enzyme R subunit